MEQIILSAITQHAENNQAQPAQVSERQVLLDQPDLLCPGDPLSGKAFDVVYLNSNKAFDTVSDSIFLDK